MSTVERSRLLKPEPYEPERSFFPIKKSRITDFMEVMERKTQTPKSGDTRNFRQYNITFSLRHLQGSLKGFNYRMRCFVHPLSDSGIEFTNWQLTVKSSGNGSDRLEYETDDNLLSPDLAAAFVSLKKKYEGDIPAEIFGLDPEGFFVNSVTMNSRIGKNGVYQFEDSEFGKLDALLMYNSDDVLFAHPHLVSDNQLMIAGKRPEAEFEFKNILLPESNDAYSIDAERKKEAFMRACDVLYQDIRPTMGDIHESDRRNKVEAADQALSISTDWASVAFSKTIKPEDYLSDDMKEKVKLLIKAAESPYQRDGYEVERRTKRITTMRSQGLLSHPMDGYFLNLMRA